MTRGRSWLAAWLGTATLTACTGDATTRTASVPVSRDPAARTASLPANWTRLGLGQRADTARIAAWDLDVDTLGHGLPAGRGTAEAGRAVYTAKCAMCHGPEGKGVPPVYPPLIGREPRAGFAFAENAKLERTVGNYWPYATTLYDYIRRAMPYGAPGSLTSDETYAVTAYLLAANEIIPMDASLDAVSLVAVRMPAHGRFVADDRAPGRP